MHVSASAGIADTATKDIWNNIKTGLLRQLRRCVAQLGPHQWHHETWWWNEHVENAIAAKGNAFKAWKTCKGTRASYDAAKCIARHAVHHAHLEADKKSTRILIPSLQKSTALLTNLEERTRMLLVTKW